MSRFRFSACYIKPALQRFSSISGQKIGRLVVLEKTKERLRNRVLWQCVCTCPKHTRVKVTTTYLRKAHIPSCGCVQKNGLAQRSTTHGASKHPLFKLWQRIKDRCRPDNKEKRSRYYDRGITVCEEWLGSYPAFRDHMLGLLNCPITAQSPGKKLGLTIDRIRNNEGYKPGNVRWATQKQQGNNRENNRPVTINGEVLNFKEAVDKYGVVSLNTVQFRVQKGWSFEKSCLTPYMRVHA